MFKKSLAFTLAMLMLLFAFCSCKGDESAQTSSNTETQGQSDPPIELTYTEENATLLSAGKGYRIIYSEDVASLTAANLRNRLISLDELDEATYEIGTDKKIADDGACEILLGLTNRQLSSAAKDMLESPLDYSIAISENKIAIYAYTTDALNKAITYFRSQLVVNEIGQVFYAQKENIVKKVTNFSADSLTIDGSPVKNFKIVVPKDADKDTLAAADGIATLLMEASGVFMTVVDDSAPATEREILIGNTSRKESKSFLEKDIDVGGDFRLGFENGRLVIVASNKAGYNNAKSYISKLISSSDKAINPAHSVATLSFEDIESVTYGAAFIDKKDNGLYFYKCTQAQMTQWATHSGDIGNNAKASTGVRLDFYTDSSYFGFRVAPESGTKFELYINGVYVKTITASDKTTVMESLDNSKGQNRVTLLFPSHSTGIISSVQLEQSATLIPYEYSTKILFTGDSITQGHGTSNDSHSYAHITTRYFNADSIIQGVGGGVFDAKTIDPALNYDPDYIIVAFGCNDWSRNRNDESGFRKKLTDFMDKLKQTYPDATVIFITPIPRLDNTSGNYDLTIEETRAIIASEAAARGFNSVSGTDLLPADRQYYNDDLHPNTKGYELYGENLCKWLSANIGIPRG